MSWPIVTGQNHTKLVSPNPTRKWGKVSTDMTDRIDHRTHIRVDPKWEKSKYYPYLGIVSRPNSIVEIIASVTTGSTNFPYVWVNLTRTYTDRYSHIESKVLILAYK